MLQPMADQHRISSFKRLALAATAVGLSLAFLSGGVPRAAAQDMEEDGELTRQRLLRRIAMAGVLIVALVASLAIFDAVFVNPPEPEAEVEPAPPVASVSVPPLEERGLETPEEKTPEAVPEAVPPPVESTEEA